MGQYHILVNLSKKQFVTPSGLGFGAKQVEHVDAMGPVLYYLTMVPERRGGGDLLEGDCNYVFIGSWLGDKIAVVGDYSLNEDLPDYPDFGEVYRLCSEKLNPMYDCFGMRTAKKYPNNPWRDITSDLAIELEEVTGKKIIPYDHPTLWPDGQRKPESMVQNLKNYKSNRS